jgi:hypothetical protein
MWQVRPSHEYARQALTMAIQDFETATIQVDLNTPHDISAPARRRFDFKPSCIGHAGRLSQRDLVGLGNQDDFRQTDMCLICWASGRRAVEQR